MRRINQAPFGGLDLALDRRAVSVSTARASVSRAASAASECRSASGRPMSPGMTLNSALRGRREEADA